jgi:hypothetical protein
MSFLHNCFKLKSPVFSTAPIYETLRLYNSDEPSNGGTNSGFLSRQKASPEPAQAVTAVASDPANGAAGKNRSIAERIKSLFGGNGRN